MSENHLYSIAERMGFWTSLMNKFKGKSQEGRTSKEREMIAADESIQAKVKTLPLFINKAKNNFKSGDLQATYNELFNYDSTLQGMLMDAAELIEFGERHKIASNLLKLANVDENIINLYKLHIERFLTKTVADNLESVKSLADDLAKSRESRNVSSYISVLRKLKTEVNNFSEKLAKLNESVIVGHKAMLDKYRRQSQHALSDAFKDIGRELREGPKDIPEFSLLPQESENVRRMRDIGEYMRAVRPESKIDDLSEMPKAASFKHRYMLSIASKIDKKYFK